MNTNLREKPSPKIAICGVWVCQEIGSREWDRTTDHLHVKEVLYH